MPSVVLFYHPGQEAIPPRQSNFVPWNNGAEHKRKFLVSNANTFSFATNTYYDQKSEISFWGEWEPRSMIVKNYPESDLVGMPRYLQRPIVVEESPRCQLTDPYVFGKTFFYITCMQGTYSLLRNLEPGSMILFGSHLAGRFVIDTVFIVSESYTDYNEDSFNVDFLNNNEFTKTYKLATLEIIDDGIIANNNLDCCGIGTTRNRFYRGVTFEERHKYNGMFSFVPCRKLENGITERFAMPALINSNQMRGVKETPNLGILGVLEKWNKIVDMLNKNNLMAGFNITTPMPPR